MMLQETQDFHSLLSTEQGGYVVYVHKHIGFCLAGNFWCHRNFLLIKKYSFGGVWYEKVRRVEVLISTVISEFYNIKDVFCVWNC